MKIKRMQDYTHLERIALGRMYLKVKNDPKDGRWRKFNDEIVYVDGVYDFFCHYRFNGDLFSVADVDIKQVSSIKQIITGVQ